MQPVRRRGAALLMHTKSLAFSCSAWVRHLRSTRTFARLKRLALRTLELLSRHSSLISLIIRLVTLDTDSPQD